jgi:hypothetical protein
VRAFLGLGVVLLASLLAAYAISVVLVEIADGPQYMYFGPFDHVRAWPVGLGLCLLAAALAVLGGRLLRRQRNGSRTL